MEYYKITVIAEAEGMTPQQIVEHMDRSVSTGEGLYAKIDEDNIELLASDCAFSPNNPDESYLRLRTLTRQFLATIDDCPLREVDCDSGMAGYLKQELKMLTGMIVKQKNIKPY